MTDETVVQADPVHPAQELVDTLLAIDAKARAAGHSLAEVLIVTARNVYGIDVRPDDPTPAEADAPQG